MLVHGCESLCWNRLDLLRRLLQLDVDQRERLLRGIYLQMGCCTASVVGEWTIIPDRPHGCAWYRSKAESTVRLSNSDVVQHDTRLTRYWSRYAHTSLEFMRQRYGGYVHGLFIVLNLVNNVFGCGSMILAGSQLVTGMTGMNVVAACILIPAGVVLYTAVGGLKATFLTDFLHTTIALILLIYYSLAVLTNEHVGGPSGLYEKVKAADWYIEGNYKGSLLSFKSEPGMYRLIYFKVVLTYIMTDHLQQYSSASSSNSATWHWCLWTRHSGRSHSQPKSRLQYLATILPVL